MGYSCREGRLYYSYSAQHEGLTDIVSYANNEIKTNEDGSITIKQSPNTFHLLSPSDPVPKHPVKRFIEDEFSPRDMEEIIAFLSVNPGITRINMSGLGITDSSALDIVNFLTIRSVGKLVDLNNNLLGNEFAAHLFELYSQKKKDNALFPPTISIDSNRITRYWIKRLTETNFPYSPFFSPSETAKSYYQPAIWERIAGAFIGIIQPLGQPLALACKGVRFGWNLADSLPLKILGAIFPGLLLATIGAVLGMAFVGFCVPAAIHGAYMGANGGIGDGFYASIRVINDNFLSIFSDCTPTKKYGFQDGDTAAAGVSSLGASFSDSGSINDTGTAQAKSWQATRGVQARGVVPTDTTPLLFADPPSRGLTTAPIAASAALTLGQSS